MGRIPFIVVLFIMAAACIGLACSERSLGWLVGGVVFFSVGVFALRQFKREAETEREGASGRFVVFAILFVVVAVLLMSAAVRFLS